MNFGGVQIAPGDYAVATQVAATFYQRENIPAPANATGAMCANTATPLARITDGLSNTLLLVEDAGRPEFWTRGGRLADQ